jgi:hypothetical protein
MSYHCPRCDQSIPLDDINVAKDVALCRRCGQSSSFADLVEEEDDDAPVIQVSHPLKGAWLQEEGRDFKVGATTRSWSALFFIPFTLLWAGGLLIMIYGAWVAQGRFEGKHFLFILPFLLGTSLLVLTCLMTTLGQVVVRVKNQQGEVFTGVGPVGWRRRFRSGEVRNVRLGTANWKVNGQLVRQLWLESAGKTLKFASGVSQERQDFLLKVLRRQLGRR